MNGIPTDRIVLDTAASTTIIHQRMVTEENYTGDAVTITGSRGSTRLYSKARMMIQLQEEQEFSQELAVSKIVTEDVLLGRNTLIGIPLLDTFPRQVRKAMWEKMNRKFAKVMVTRAQARRNQKLLLLRPKEEGGITEEFESSCCSGGASEEGEELESLSTEVLEENQSAEKSEMEKGINGRRSKNCNHTNQNSICENIEFNFDDILFQEPRRGRINTTRAEKRRERRRRTGCNATREQLIEALQKDPDIQA